MVNQLIKEINIALEHDCYLIALASVLTLPDICGKAKYPHAKTSVRYKNWYDTYIGQYEKSPECSYEWVNKIPYASGDIVYSIRNALLHDANLQDVREEQELTDFHLLISKSDTLGVISGIDADGKEKTISIGIRNLCGKICNAAQWYYQNNKDKFHFDYNVIEWEI